MKRPSRPRKRSRKRKNAPSASPSAEWGSSKIITQPPQPTPAQQPATPPWVQSDQGDQSPIHYDVEHRKKVAAIQSSLVEPILPPSLTEAAQRASPFTIIPTVYPQNPSGGTIIVQNHITININSKEFREVAAKLDEVIKLLRGSNEIAGETRDQLIAEIKAGRAVLDAPKPDPKLIELFFEATTHVHCQSRGNQRHRKNSVGSVPAARQTDRIVVTCAKARVW
jgi:hypothetical protein